MFGASQQQTGGGLFGQSTQQQQPTGGLFSGLNQNNQQNQQQQSGGLFGSLGQNNQQNQQPSTGLFGQNNQQGQQPAGQFNTLGQSNQQNQQQGGGLFGNSQQQQGGLFNSSQQQPFGGSTQVQPGLGNSMWQPNSGINPREKSVNDQIEAVLSKWDINSPNCAFRYYFYNKVEDNRDIYYGPGPNEDPKEWEEALSKKPGPGLVPALCVGFTQLGVRISAQQKALALYNSKLHEINSSLTNMLQTHETNTSIRALNARRRHLVMRQKCLRLATKVQVLRNRGYALGGDEEDLRIKLQALEKGVSDPGLGARAEEIWARMLTVQERAKLLKSEIEKNGMNAPDMLDEEATAAAKKILEDYDRQLLHMKKELDSVQKDFVEWEKDQPKINGR